MPKLDGTCNETSLSRDFHSRVARWIVITGLLVGTIAPGPLAFVFTTFTSHRGARPVIGLCMLLASSMLIVLAALAGCTFSRRAKIGLAVITLLAQVAGIAVGVIASILFTGFGPGM